MNEGIFCQEKEELVDVKKQEINNSDKVLSDHPNLISFLRSGNFPKTWGHYGFTQIKEENQEIDRRLKLLSQNIETFIPKYQNNEPRSLKEIEKVWEYFSFGTFGKKYTERDEYKNLYSQIMTSDSINSDFATVFRGISKFDGNLKISDEFKNLSVIPESLKEVTGDLTLPSGDFSFNNCQNFKIGGDLNLNRDIKVNSWPKQLLVIKNFDLSKNKAINELPEEIIVGEDLIMDESNVERLSGKMTINGDLRAGNCIFKKLPDNLKVGKTLNLNFCHNLTELPRGLSVGENLSLINASLISSLPDDVKIGKDLLIDGSPVQTLFTITKKNETKITFENEDFKAFNKVYDSLGWSDHPRLSQLQAILAELTWPRTINSLFEKRIRQTNNLPDDSSILEEKIKFLSRPKFLNYRLKAAEMSKQLIESKMQKVGDDSIKLLSFLVKANDLHNSWQNKVFDYFETSSEIENQPFSIDSDADIIVNSWFKKLEKSDNKIDLYTGPKWMYGWYPIGADLELKTLSGKVTEISYNEIIGSQSGLIRCLAENFPEIILKNHRNIFDTDIAIKGFEFKYEEKNGVIYSGRHHDMGESQYRMHINTDQLNNDEIRLLLKYFADQTKEYAKSTQKPEIKILDNLEIGGEVNRIEG